MQLSKNFTLEELEFSQTATRHNINNQASLDQILILQQLCEKVLQPIRDYYNLPVRITSGFRGVELNRRVGGSKTSEHCISGKSAAADFVVVGKSVKEVFDDIRLGKIKGLAFNQLINEFSSWIHISYSIESNKNQVLVARKVNGKTVYTVV